MKIDAMLFIIFVFVTVWPEEVGRIAAEVYNNFEIYSTRYELWEK